MSKTFAAAKNRRKCRRYILVAALSRQKRTHIKQKNISGGFKPPEPHPYKTKKN
jgi:hypothetical protein